jgi:hypothetical protein
MHAILGTVGGGPRKCYSRRFDEDNASVGSLNLAKYPAGSGYGDWTGCRSHNSIGRGSGDGRAK